MIADNLLLYNITHESHPWHMWGTCWERRNVWVSSTFATLTGCVFCEVSTEFKNTGDHRRRKKKCSMDSMVDKNKNGETDLFVEFLSLHCPSGMPLHLMKLKVCAFIIWSYFRSWRRINRWDRTGGSTSCDKHISSISSGGTCHDLGECSFG